MFRRGSPSPCCGRSVEPATATYGEPEATGPFCPNRVALTRALLVVLRPAQSAARPRGRNKGIEAQDMREAPRIIAGSGGLRGPT